MKDGFQQWDEDSEIEDDEELQENLSGVTNTLLVNGIDDTITEDELRGLFTHHQSDIIEVRIIRNSETGRAIGYSHIVFESKASALSALNLLGGDKSIVLLSNGARGVATFSKSHAILDLAKFNLYVGNLGPDIAQRAVENWLIDIWNAAPENDVPKKFNVNVPPHPITKRKFGFAFIRVPNDEDFALKLIDIYETKKSTGETRFSINGSWPIFKSLRKRIDDPNLSPTTVCALGLPESVSEKEVTKFFEAVGPVASVKITLTKHLAFITYGFTLSAFAAITHFDGMTMRSRPLRLLWAKTAHGIFPTFEGMRTTGPTHNDVTEWQEAMVPKSSPAANNGFKEETLSPEEMEKWRAKLVQDLQVDDLMSSLIDAPPPPPPPS